MALLPLLVQRASFGPFRLCGDTLAAIAAQAVMALAESQLVATTHVSASGAATIVYTEKRNRAIRCSEKSYTVWHVCVQM